jgi:hypothetical protein
VQDLPAADESPGQGHRSLAALLRDLGGHVHNDQLRVVVSQSRAEEKRPRRRPGGVGAVLRLPGALAARGALPAPHHHLRQARVGEGGARQEELRLEASPQVRGELSGAELASGTAVGVVCAGSGGPRLFTPETNRGRYRFRLRYFDFADTCCSDEGASAGVWDRREPFPFFFCPSTQRKSSPVHGLMKSSGVRREFADAILKRNVRCFPAEFFRIGKGRQWRSRVQ